MYTHKETAALITKDEALHVPLGLAFAGIVWVLITYVPHGIGFDLTAGFFLYMREVTQAHTRLQVPFFSRSGWVLDYEHTREWLVPLLIIAAVHTVIWWLA